MVQQNVECMLKQKRKPFEWALKLKAEILWATSRSDRSLGQAAPCLLLAKQIAATQRLFGAQAVILCEGGYEISFSFNMADHMELTH